MKGFIANSKQLVKRRLSLYTPRFNFCSSKEIINFKFKYMLDSKEVEVQAEAGKSVLEIAHEYKVDLEGACDSALACSTCHVVFEEELFNKLPTAESEEEDLLDLAFGLTLTSRLGCQIKVNKEFEGTVVLVPSATKNFYVDGFKPKPH